MPFALPAHPENVPVLRLDSRLQDLTLYEATFDLEAEGKLALRLLKADPHIPGVILVKGRRLVGMISRRRIYEKMSLSYGPDLFLTRPLSQLYKYTKTDHLVLPQKMLVTEGARRALQRPTELLADPIIVALDKNHYQILDIHQLLVAHARIFELTSALLEETNQQLKRLAVIDPLTKIGNRRFFEQYFARDWQYAVREEKWISLVICDVDFFKQYNDAYGHPQGDQCLCQIAQCLRSGCRRSTDIVARYGGEEFVLVLLGTKPEAALKIVKKIQGELAAQNLAHQASPLGQTVTLSFGVASLKPEPGQDQQILIDRADQALYQAKREGRNRYCLAPN
ncbi:MAG: diguanylate cyclase domain-containing protein [Cyanobacteriota bacterium]|jgi:diguanylate cyclase (GGDEF)-like protein